MTKDDKKIQDLQITLLSTKLNNDWAVKSKKKWSITNNKDAYIIPNLQIILNGGFKGIIIDKWIYHCNRPDLLYNTTTKIDKEPYFEDIRVESPIPKTIIEFKKLIDDNKWGDHQWPEFAICDMDDYIRIFYGS